MNKPRTKQVCPSCGIAFRKQRARETYCSIHCAVWPRIACGAPDECWLWQGQLVGGYGAGSFQKQRYRVNRVVLEEKLGQPIPDGMQALHRCDNPACCNPAHLFLGTPKDNMEDKVRKGRQKNISPRLRGEEHGMAILTEENVRFIWANRDTISNKELAARFGVAKDVVWKVRHRKTWRHLTNSLQ